VAGCDLPRVSDPDLPAKYMVALELYNGHVVTGEARSSAFDALFSGGRVHDQGALLGWFTIHENDADLLIDNRTPGEWDIFRTNLISDIETLGTFSEQAASPERKRLRPWS
jgi:hypothetical protein